MAAGPYPLKPAANGPMLVSPPVQASFPAPAALPPATPYCDEAIERRLNACPKLASLQTINRALRELMNSDHSLNSQIAAVIRRDPSLAARLLRMVNSVYLGSTMCISSIDEAVFFLGLRQIRELATATPVIEDLQQLHPGKAGAAPLPWVELWRHSIGTAALTREILHSTNITVDDDTDYLAGLLHNVGKVVMAYAFPEESRRIMDSIVPDPDAVCALERELIGWDHARIGAHYLARHQLSEEIAFAVLYHNEPDRAPRHRLFAAAVQVADRLVRYAGISGGFESIEPVKVDSWLQLPGWAILHGVGGEETALARAHLASSLQRLPAILRGLV